MILHGPNFWKWFIGPGTIYMLERIRRIAWSRSQLGKTYISSGLLLPSRVTHLVIKRPPHFVFHPGDYVFVNIPVIARYEWHPFTISSAPEQEGSNNLFYITNLKLCVYFSVSYALMQKNTQNPYTWVHNMQIYVYTYRIPTYKISRIRYWLKIFVSESYLYLTSTSL